MDDLFHGKPYEQMDALGNFPTYFWFNTQIYRVFRVSMGLRVSIPNGLGSIRLIEHGKSELALFP